MVSALIFWRNIVHTCGPDHLCGSDHLRPSPWPGKKKMAALVAPSKARANNPRWIPAACPAVWGARLGSFSLQWNSSNFVCQHQFFACVSLHCVSFTCIECVGNVCEAKVATDTHMFRRSSPQPTSHLHKSYCFFPWLNDPRTQCLYKRRSGKGKPKILLPFDQSKGLGLHLTHAWTRPGLPALHDERCWLVTAFKT